MILKSASHPLLTHGAVDQLTVASLALAAVTGAIDVHPTAALLWCLWLLDLQADHLGVMPSAVRAGHSRWPCRSPAPSPRNGVSCVSQGRAAHWCWGAACTQGILLGWCL